LQDNRPLYQVCRYLTFCKVSEDGDVDPPGGEGDTRRTGVLLRRL